jgi:hypothetical protein
MKYIQWFITTQLKIFSANVNNDSCDSNAPQEKYQQNVGVENIIGSTLRM